MAEMNQRKGVDEIEGVAGVIERFRPQSLFESGADTGMRPNILLITTDQQRRDTLGCYGRDDVNRVWSGLESSHFVNSFSPHADRLAREGVRFTQV